MNSEEAGLLWNRKLDIEQAGGEAAHRQHALKHLKLKTVIKVRKVVARHSASLLALSLNDRVSEMVKFRRVTVHLCTSCRSTMPPTACITSSQQLAMTRSAECDAS